MSRWGDQRTSQGSDSLFWWEPKPEDPDEWPRPTACCHLCFHTPALKDLLVLVQVALRSKGISLWPHMGSSRNFLRYCRRSKRKIFILWVSFLCILLLVFLQHFQVGFVFFIESNVRFLYRATKETLLAQCVMAPIPFFSQVLFCICLLHHCRFSAAFSYPVVSWYTRPSSTAGFSRWWPLRMSF